MTMLRNSPRTLLSAIFALFTVLAVSACDDQKGGDQGQAPPAPTQPGNR
jgi:hypothetical protein